MAQELRALAEVLHHTFVSGLYIIYTRPYIYEVELSISYIEWRLCSEGQLARPWAFAARMAVTFIEQYKQCRALRIESEFCCRLDGSAAAARSGVQASACAPHHKPYFLIKFLYGFDFVMLEVCSRRCAAPLARSHARPPALPSCLSPASACLTLSPRPPSRRADEPEPTSRRAVPMSRRRAA